MSTERRDDERCATARSAGHHDDGRGAAARIAGYHDGGHQYHHYSIVTTDVEMLLLLTSNEPVPLGRCCFLLRPRDNIEKDTEFSSLHAAL